jgi:transcriptional regulator with PAS, ATPase and Fis domain
MTPSAQVKLLRVLQDGEFMRIGGNRVIKTDVRIIAATNVELIKAVEAGKFRLDLFYRLNVYPIYVPALRERREDIRPLVIHFIKLYQKKSGKHVVGITQKALELLESYNWPGNVRELENAIERAVILAAGRMITINDLPEMIRGRHEEPHQSAGESEVGAPMEEVERRMVLESLMPPLNERKEYLYLLVVHFIELYGKKHSRRVARISDGAVQALKKYDWLGGIRELESVIEHAVASATGETITVNDLPEKLRGQHAESSSPMVEIEIGVPMDEVERRVILQTLSFTGGDKTKTARLLKIGRKTLYRKLEKYRREAAPAPLT